MQTRNIENYAMLYTNKDFSFEEIMVEYRRKQVLQVLESNKPKSILEIGCGLDSISNYYKEYENFTIIEPSYKFASKAKEDSRDNQKITIINDFVENQIMNLHKENFDCILLSSLLHEIANPKDFLQDIVKLCTTNTLLHINVPNANSFHLVWAYESGLIESLGNLSQTAKNLEQHTAFTLQSLESLAKECGLTIKENGSYFIKPFNHAKMAVLCNQTKEQEAIISNKLLAGLDKMIKYMPNLGAEIFINCKKAS